MDSFNELKLQVVEALRSKGVLGSIKAEIRASVYSILQEEEQAKGVHRENKIIREVAESQKGILLLSLISDALRALNLSYTLDCFLAESTLEPNQFIPPHDLAQRLNVESKPQQPLLAQLLSGKATLPSAAPLAQGQATNTSNTIGGGLDTGDLKTSNLDRQIEALLSKQFGESSPTFSSQNFGETGTSRGAGGSSSSAPPAPSAAVSQNDIPSGPSLVKEEEKQDAAPSSTPSPLSSSPTLSSPTPYAAEPPAPPTTSASTLTSLPPAKTKLSALSDLPPLGGSSLNRQKLAPLSSEPPATGKEQRGGGAGGSGDREAAGDDHLQQLDRKLAQMEAENPQLRDVRSAYESGAKADKPYGEELGDSGEEPVEEDIYSEDDFEISDVDEGATSKSPRGELEDSFEDSTLQSKVEAVSSGLDPLTDMDLDFVENLEL